ncbi:MAG: hypothetical protein MJE77_41670 [Proteobacteria bacterium]|nr:hypothetical protein [Pseudomonadota bacterium]
MMMNFRLTMATVVACLASAGCVEEPEYIQEGECTQLPSCTEGQALLANADGEWACQSTLTELQAKVDAIGSA